MSWVMSYSSRMELEVEDAEFEVELEVEGDWSQ